MSGRSGGLTWAQREWFMWVPPGSPNAFEANQTCVSPGYGAGLDHVITAVRDVLARHEGLRTLVSREPGHASGELRQHVQEVDERLADVIRVHRDGGELGQAAWHPFDLTAEWPVRVHVFTAGRRVRRIALVLDHSAVDAWAIRVLCSDLAAAIRARSSGLEPYGPREVEQPIDAAGWEASPQGRAHQARAERFWHARLTDLRGRLDGHRARPRASRSLSAEPYHSCRLASGRLAGAATALSAASGLPVASVYLAAFGVSVRRAEEAPAAGVFAFTANRLSPGAKASVRKAVMHAPVVVGDGGLSDELHGCAAQQLHGHRFANLDPRESTRMCDELLGGHHRTGVAYARFNYIDDTVVGPLANSRSLDEEAIRYQDPAEQERLFHRRPRGDGAEYQLTVQHSTAGALLTLAWREDTGWGEQAEDMLRGLAELVVGEASR
ncbi:condensation domain-containing protein [Nonomuraea soli]|uniref:Condensation domain-containing protein n=1 Tax=Nonomuraea soli TaxID=1032476 RepID=A0A7W0HRE5_9ACTN|nr:condensation domain-containing protein [Nonomuraea soli]MBA2892914.1 hypothetical protein [Nonomuraea soli]